jgi:hypothetical protein
MTSSTSNQSQASFATTRWAMITQIFRPGERAPSDALGELCLRYRYPVYAYVRHCGHAAPIALDITLSFLHHLLQHFKEQGQPPMKEHFRRYLLARLHAYLAADWRGMRDEVVDERDASVEDLETRYLRDSAHAESPEQVFQRGFALEVLTRSFKRLHAEARQTGHADMYEALAPFLAHDPAPGQYDEVARQLHTRPLTIVVALKRLRQRLHELSSEELADTVSSAEEFAAEQQALFAVLQGTD